MNSAAFTPMPRASVSTATALKPGFLSNRRKANLYWRFAMADLAGTPPSQTQDLAASTGCALHLLCQSPGHCFKSHSINGIKKLAPVASLGSVATCGNLRSRGWDGLTRTEALVFRALSCSTFHVSRPHSHRKASIGSTRAARRAGSQHAMAAMRINRSGTPAKVSGS